MKKRLFAVLVCLVMIVSLTGCNLTPPTQTATPTKPASTQTDPGSTTSQPEIKLVLQRLIH